jgi:hypothetical protein
LESEKLSLPEETIDVEMNEEISVNNAHEYNEKSECSG